MVWRRHVRRPGHRTDQCRSGCRVRQDLGQPRVRAAWARCGWVTAAWALTTDVIYMGLQGSKNNLTAEFDQWMVEPTLSYRVCRYFEALAGARYNNLSGELRGPGAIIPSGVIRSGTQEWWDPMVGGNVSVPLGRGFSFNVRGDLGDSARDRILPGRRFPTWAGSSPNGARSRPAIAGSTWTTKPAAARADSNMTS